MTKQVNCGYGGDRDRAIVEYLYGECDPGERSAFDVHLADCAACRAEVQAFRGVRQVLAGWAPPEPMRALEHERTRAIDGPRLAASREAGGRQPAPVDAAPSWRRVPAWARAAAAVLCIGVGVGAANLRVSYGSEGLTVRTGWLETTGAAPAAPAEAGRDVNAAPWRADLAALESRMRTEMRDGVGRVQSASAVSASDQATHDAELLKQVRGLIQRSEERQEQAMALRVATLMNDVQAQRQADMVRVNQAIGVVQSNTGMEVMRQGQMLRSLAVKVSSQR